MVLNIREKPGHKRGQIVLRHPSASQQKCGINRGDLGLWITRARSIFMGVLTVVREEHPID